MNTFAFSGISQIVQETVRLPISALISVGIALLLAWMCWRTRSTHIVISRVWRLFYGKAVLQDREIVKFIETRNRLVMFRFFSGLPKVRTLARAKHIIRWSMTNDEEVADIKACGDLFDLETCELRVNNIPGKFIQLIKGMGALIFLIAAISTIGGVLSENAFLQFNESKKWFLLTHEQAKPFWSEGILTKKACNEEEIRKSSTTGFSDEERTSICKSLNEPDTPAFIERTVTQQRYAFSALVMYLFYFAWMLWASFRKGMFATELRDRLATKPARNLTEQRLDSIDSNSSLEPCQ